MNIGKVNKILKVFFRGQTLNMEFTRKFHIQGLTPIAIPKVAIGACMTKITFYIYATLRNQKPFILQQLNIYNLKLAA